ncbi:MAG: T9SS type A sorting domain-containing protein, partial [Bacteroidales bacterium]|nr:T9SS type A sorting domain-containing protein [Bacteroidales bacterium]
ITNASICHGEIYSFMDSLFTTTGIYPIVQNDTIHKLNLTVYPIYNDTLDINVCNGESYTYNDTIYSSSCYHTSYFQSIHGCDSVVTLHLTVLPEIRPIITITEDTSICRGDSITLTANGASSYFWNNNATTQSITVSPFNTTKYIVTASNSLDCYIKDTVIVTVKALPTPSISGTTIFCDGNSSTLTANGGVSYLWNTGDTTYSIIVDTAGIYSVLATGVNGCRKEVQKNVTVCPLPELSLNINDTSICLGESLLLIASGGSSYVWSSNQTSNSINVTPNSSISYSVTAYNSYNCSKTDTINVTVNPIPILSFVGDTSFCTGSATSITIYGAENYLWSNGETSSTLSLNPSSSTQYSVTGTNSYQCSSSLNIPIIVHQPIFTIDTIHSCNSYTWIDGNTYTSSTNTPSYTLTSIYGCDSIVNLNLTIHQTENTIDYVSACNSFTWINGITYTQSTNTPTYTINSIYGCDSIVNLHLTMNHSSSGVDNQVHCKTYTWINGITYTSSTNTPTYTLTNYSGCDSVVHLNLTINPLPNVGITGNMDIFEGQTTELIASGANSYSWSNGSIEQTISVSPTQTTKYSVIGTDDKNCSDSASITINVHPNIGLNNIEISNLISIYPNPTDGKINIVNKSNELSIQKITLLNVLGEKILEKEITNRNEILLDLISYSSNIIFVEILLNNGEKFVKKIIKN